MIPHDPREQKCSKWCKQMLKEGIMHYGAVSNTTPLFILFLFFLDLSTQSWSGSGGHLRLQWLGSLPCLVSLPVCGSTWINITFKLHSKRQELIGFQTIWTILFSLVFESHFTTFRGLSQIVRYLKFTKVSETCGYVKCQAFCRRRNWSSEQWGHLTKVTW